MSVWIASPTKTPYSQWRTAEVALMSVKSHVSFTYESPQSMRNCKDVLHTNCIIYKSTSKSISLFGVCRSEYSHLLKVTPQTTRAFSKRPQMKTGWMIRMKSRQSEAIKIHLSSRLWQFTRPQYWRRISWKMLQNLMFTYSVKTVTLQKNTPHTHLHQVSVLSQDWDKTDEVLVLDLRCRYASSEIFLCPWN